MPNVDESKEWYVTQLLKLTGYNREYLESLNIMQLYNLYCERLESRGMV